MNATASLLRETDIPFSKPSKASNAPPSGIEVFDWKAAVPEDFSAEKEVPPQIRIDFRIRKEVEKGRNEQKTENQLGE